MRQSIPSTRRVSGNGHDATATAAATAADSDEDEERPLTRTSPDTATAANTGASPRDGGLSDNGSGGPGSSVPMRSLLPVQSDPTHRPPSVAGARPSSTIATGLRACVEPAAARFMAAPRWQQSLLVLSLLCVLLGGVFWWRSRQEDILQLSVRQAETSHSGTAATHGAASASSSLASPPTSLFPAVCASRHPAGLESMGAAVPSAGQRYFIALNLHNSESNGVLASLRVELLRLISVIAWNDGDGGDVASSSTRRLVPSNVFVSIYESGSSDGTVAGLRSLAAELRGAGVPHRIVVQGALRKGEHRIESLAAMRNAALDPLYDAGRALAEGRKDDPNAVVYDRLLFINDVLFCAEDILRLLTPLTAEGKAPRAAQEMRVVVGLQPPPRPRSGLPDMLCAMDFEYEDVRAVPPGGPLGFYDYWVMRDRGGAQMQGRFPLRFKDERDQHAWDEARRIDVQCCWGGAVSLSASVFQSAGLSIRSRTEACASSECSSVCSDIIGMRGADAWIQIDSLAATTYRREGHEALNQLPWFNVQQRTKTREARDRQRQAPTPQCTTGPDQAQETESAGPASAVSACPPEVPVYPARLYRGVPLSYPPPLHCCSEYRESRHYWLHCANVQTLFFSDEQKARIRAADHDFMLDLYDASFDPK